MNRWYRHEGLKGRLSTGRARLPSSETAQLLEASQGTRRAMREEDRGRRLVGLALTAAIAALAHGAVLLPLFALWMFTEPDPLDKTGTRMVSLSKAQWEKNRKLKLDAKDRELTKREEEEKLARAEPEEPIPDGQIVSLPKPAKQEVPEHADYVAADFHRAERETRSRHQSQNYKNPTFKPQLGRDEPMKVHEESRTETKVAARSDGVPGGPLGEGRALDGAAGMDTQTGGGAPRLAFEVPKQSARESLQLQRSQDGRHSNHERREEVQSDGDRFEVALGRHADDATRSGEGMAPQTGLGARGGAGAQGLPSLAQLTPSLVELERIAGMPANDALDEVETDAETRLNAWRWKHATFIDRVKKGVNRTWRGGAVFQRHDPTRQVYGSQDLVTWLAVTIDKQGNVIEVNVLEQSGADFLDDEAVRSMQAAAPFTNPPTAIFGKGETFTFRFGFQIRNQWSHFDMDWRPY
jgi:TonB family protein